MDQELSENGSQETAQQKIQALLNTAACTQVTVELTEYTISYEGIDTSVRTLYLKDSLTVPQGKELVMNCYFQVGSNDSYSDKAQEPDGRARAAGTITVNGTLTVNNGMSLCTGRGVGVSAVTIGSTGTLTDHTSGTNEIIGNVDNRGTLPIAAGGGWQLSSGSTPTTFTNSGTIENAGTIENLAGNFTNSGTFTNSETFNNYRTFTNESGGTFTSTGTFYTSGPFANNGTFINTGTVEAITGTSITNAGTFQLNAGSQVTIDAVFKNSGTVTMTGDSSSPSVFSSNSTSSSDGVSNQAGGTIEIGAFGRFENNDSVGGVENDGTILIYSDGTLTTTNKFTNRGTLTNDGTYYGPPLTGGTIDGANAGQVTGGNPQP